MVEDQTLGGGPMRVMIAAVIAALGVNVCPSATALGAKSDVQELLQDCSSVEGSPSWFSCIGYISGVSDLMGVNGFLRSKLDKDAIDKTAPLSMCANGPMPTYGARLQAFKNWAQKHPERWADANLAGVGAAMRETWPCK